MTRLERAPVLETTESAVELIFSNASQKRSPRKGRSPSNQYKTNSIDSSATAHEAGCPFRHGDSSSPTRIVRLQYPATGAEVVVLLYEKEAGGLARITQVFLASVQHMSLKMRQIQRLAHDVLPCR